MGLRAAAALLVASAAAGCSDADPQEPAGPSRQIVTVTTGSPPALIAFRDEATADWQSLTLAAVTTFDIAVTGLYEVVVVCEWRGDDPTAFVTQYARTPDDERTINVPCPTGVYPFTVHGQMAGSGTVAFGGLFSAAAAGPEIWDFEFPADPGSFDLVMVFGDFPDPFSDIAIRRGVAVARDTDLGLLDRSNETVQPLVPARFTATNARPEESLVARLSLDTGGTIASLFSREVTTEGWVTALIPDSALRSSDRQRIRLSGSVASSDAEPQTNRRRVDRDVRVGDPMSATLPEPLGRVRFEVSTAGLLATWSTLPEYDTLTLSCGAFNTRLPLGVSHESVFSRRFVEARGATNVALDLRNVPGFKREWQDDLTSEQSCSLAATRRTSPSETVYSAADEIVSPTASHARRSDAMRRLAR